MQDKNEKTIHFNNEAISAMWINNKKQFEVLSTLKNPILHLNNTIFI